MEQSPGAFCEAPTTPNGDGGSMSPREQSSGAPESTASVPMADAVVTAVVTPTGDAREEMHYGAVDKKASITPRIPLHLC